MQFHSILTLFLATTVTSAAVSSAEASTNDIVARFPSSVMEASALVDRSIELEKRKCDCGKAFSCSKSVTECCKSTGGYGMCKTDINKCKCGRSCNPLQCKW